MDFNSIINTLMSSDSVSQLSNLSGTSEKDVSSVLTSALPQLLSGAQGQATSADTAESFANALTAHSQKDSNDLASFFNGVDMEDGQKIVEHLLGKDNAMIKSMSKDLFNVFKAKYGAVTCGEISDCGKDKSPCVELCLFSADEVCKLLKDYDV